MEINWTFKKGILMMKQYINLKRSIHILLPVLFMAQLSYAEEYWKFTLKNAYIDRNFKQGSIADTGSWSQGASLFYTSPYYNSPLVIVDKPLQIGIDGSLQYAVRLSPDKHVDDTVLPFDNVNKKQAADYLKDGATLKLKYAETELRYGELWLNLPMTTVDTSRQLLTSYQGVNLTFPIKNKLNVELGHVTKNSPRNVEGFQKFSFTQNGMKHYSDGLDYINLNYNPIKDLNVNYYFGRLENLYDKHYLGINYNHKINDLLLTTKFRYFNSQDNSQAVDIDSQNIGLLESLKLGNQTIGMGYQKIVGDAYPLPDGFLPELYFINWNVTGFFKKNESSWHFIYGYDFKNYIQGLNATFKYARGNKIKLADGLENSESEYNLLATYQIQNPKLKGLSLQYLLTKYDQKYGNDFLENRFFVNYQIKF